MRTFRLLFSPSIQFPLIFTAIKVECNRDKSYAFKWMICINELEYRSQISLDAKVVKTSKSTYVINICIF